MLPPFIQVSVGSPSDREAGCVPNKRRSCRNDCVRSKVAVSLLLFPSLLKNAPTSRAACRLRRAHLVHAPEEFEHWANSGHFVRRRHRERPAHRRHGGGGG